LLTGLGPKLNGKSTKMGTYVCTQLLLVWNNLVNTS
jgi:hypothetical protein